MSETREPRASRAARALRILLRVVGTSSITALVFVAAPHSWMISIHELAGLGEMPRTPVVWYLARSTSAFYALVGGLFWLVSFDLRRYRRLLIYIGWGVVGLGVTLLLVDWIEGMPLYWAAWEGPFVIALGVAVVSLTYAIPSVEEARG